MFNASKLCVRVPGKYIVPTMSPIKYPKIFKGFELVAIADSGKPRIARWFTPASFMDSGQTFEQYFKDESERLAKLLEPFPNKTWKKVINIHYLNGEIEENVSMAKVQEIMEEECRLTRNSANFYQTMRFIR